MRVIAVIREGVAGTEATSAAGGTKGDEGRLFSGPRSELFAVVPLSRLVLMDDGEVARRGSLGRA